MTHESPRFFFLLFGLTLVGASAYLHLAGYIPL